MSARSGWHTSPAHAAVLAGLAALSFTAAWLVSMAAPAVFHELDGRASDLLHHLRYRARGRGTTSPFVVHVVVTDRSRQDLNLSAWDRRVYGRALQVLQRLEARTIVCDVFFRDASFSDNDALLLQAARAGGRILFPLLALPVSPPGAGPGGPAPPGPEKLPRLEVEREGTPPAAAYLAGPFPDLARAAGGLGLINLEPDADGVSRRIPLVYRWNNTLVPSLGLAAAIQFLRIEPGEVKVAFGRRILLRGARPPNGPPVDIAIPIDQSGRMVINPVGPWADSFATVAIEELLRADADERLRPRLRELLEGALVVLSDTSTMNRDHGPGIFDRTYPLGGLHVSVANSILAASFLQDQGIIHRAAVVLVMAALLWLAAWRLRGLAFSAACAAVYLAFLAACYWSFDGLHRVPAAALPSAGFLLAVAALTAYRVVLVERERSASEAWAEAGRSLAEANAELTRQKMALERANATLRDMERSREESASRVAEELRGPIAGMLESLESIWVERRADLTPAVVHDLQRTRGRAEELLGAVNRMVGNGRPEPSTRGPPVPRPADGLAAGGEPVLLAGSSRGALSRCSAILGQAGIPSTVEQAGPGGVLPALRRQACCAVVLDLDPGRVAAAELIPNIRSEFPSLQVIVLARGSEISAAAECIRQGAADYLPNPPEPGPLAAALLRCMERRKIEQQVRALSHRLSAMELKNPAAFAGIITASPRMRTMFRYVEAIATEDSPVLITGESGVGKELLAGVIHALSGRRGACVRENVAGLDDAMITDTLFGHVRGAFTDAREARRGLVEEAAGGTLFLDEIGDMPVNSQVKLLRFIEGGEYRPLGSDAARTSDARVVIATNVDLPARLREGRFREDLFYRFTHRVEIPPLRDRPEDLPLLLDHFAGESAAARGRGRPSIPSGLVELLRAYPFPGNVRELRNMVDNAVSRSADTVLPVESFRESVRGSRVLDRGDRAERPAGMPPVPAAAPTLREAEAAAIEEALRRSGGNQKAAARLLGMSPSALSRRLRRGGPKP